MDLNDFKAALKRELPICQKAAIALYALRATRPVGVTGVGPNRDDFPIFRKLAHDRMGSVSIPKDDLYVVQARVYKYYNQLSQCRYFAQIADPDLSPHQFANIIKPEVAVFEAERELHLFLKNNEDSAYGGW